MAIKKYVTSVDDVSGGQTAELLPDWNEAGSLVKKEYVDSVLSGGGGVRSRYFTKTASGIGTMYKAIDTLPTGGLKTINATATTGTTLVAEFITEIQTSPVTSVSGVRNISLQASTTYQGEEVQLYAETYKCDLVGGSQVLLITTNISPILTNLSAGYSINSYGSYIVQPITERRIIKIYAKRNILTGNDPVISLEVEDNTYSRLDIPSPVGVTTLQGAYQNSGQTQITTDIIRGAVQLKRGSNSDTDNVIEVLDGIGSTKTAIKGNGQILLTPGTISANTAPLKFTSGPLNTTPEIGAVEFLNDGYYGTVTTGSTRKQFAFKDLLYRVVVGPIGKYATLKEAVDYLNSNATAPTEIYLDGGEHLVNDTITINNPYVVAIRSASSGNCKVKATTGLTNKPMFDIVTECYMNRFSVDGSTLTSYGTLNTENCFNITGGVYFEAQDMVYNGFYRQVYMTGVGASTFLFNSIYQKPVFSAVCIFSTGANTLDIETNTFTNCPIGIELSKSTDGEFDIINNIFDNDSSGQTSIVYTPGVGNYIIHTHSSVEGNKRNNVGSLYSGFDFTRSDGRDANVYMISNCGKEDKRPHAKINMINNALGIRCTEIGSWYKVAGVNTNSYTCKTTISNLGMRYQSVNPTDGMMWISGALTTDQSNNNVDIAIRKEIPNCTPSDTGATVTVTTTQDHGILSGQTISVTGTGGNVAYFGTFTVLSVTNKTFTYTSVGGTLPTTFFVGLIIAPITVRVITTNSYINFSFNVYLDGMTQDDIYELYVADQTNITRIVTVSDLARLFNCL